MKIYPSCKYFPRFPRTRFIFMLDIRYLNAENLVTGLSTAFRFPRHCQVLMVFVMRFQSIFASAYWFHHILM
jgi:hypothetical protein